jgi:hypothetical protein
MKQVFNGQRPGWESNPVAAKRGNGGDFSEMRMGCAEGTAKGKRENSGDREG